MRLLIAVCVITSLVLAAGRSKGRELAPGSPPQFTGGTSFHGDRLNIAVGAAVHTPRYERRDYEPRIQEVRVLIDGKPTATEAQVTSSWGLGGWYQSAGFNVPPEARAGVAELRINHIGKMFAMTVPFERHTSHVNADVKWDIKYDEIKIQGID